MATRKKKVKEDSDNNSTVLPTDVKTTKQQKRDLWPKVTIGSHSVRTEYQDGRVDFVWNWEALQRDVRDAIASVENKTEEKPKRTRKAKT